MAEQQDILNIDRVVYAEYNVVTSYRSPAGTMKRKAMNA